MNNKALAHALLWLVALAPAVVAAFHAPPASSAPGDWLNFLGRIAGIAGFGMLLVAAAVSFRLPGVDRWFGGLTKLWNTHHLLGCGAFLLLLVHPLLLAMAAVPLSLSVAIGVLFPPDGGGAVWLGWIALVSMMVFMAPSLGFFGPPKYQRWKSIHRLSAVTAVFGLVHTLALSRSIESPYSEWLWWTLATLALAALAYGLILARWRHRYPYRVSVVHRVAPNVVELSLEALARPMAYRAGQFVYLCHQQRNLHGRGEEHPYTLSSSPDEAVLRVAVKDLGDASRALQSVVPGTAVALTGPYGDFFPQSSGRELWIAGGIGITPFLGRLRWLAGRGEAVDIGLIYCVQDEARALFVEELRQLNATLPGFNLTVHYFYQHGPLSSDFLRYHCRDIASREVYICGPGPLLQLARDLALANGVSRRRLHTEEFNLL